MEKEHFSQEELRAHIDRVCRALEKSGHADLYRLVQRLTSITRADFKETCPFGLIGNPEHGHVEITMQPDVTCKLTHMVLSPETAKSYDLDAFMMANISQIQ